MLHEFLDANRPELIERCRSKVVQRTGRQLNPVLMEHGVPLFLGQLIEMLRDEDTGLAAREGAKSESWRAAANVRIATGATQHGLELLRGGYTVDNVVRDYGDLCQAVTELSIERASLVTTAEFRTLNRCLDNAIAVAVTEFAREREVAAAATDSQAMNERLGFLAHELRNFLNTAILAFAAIKSGSVAANGSTSAVMDRSLLGLRDLIDRALADVRLTSGPPTSTDVVPVDRFIAEMQVAGCLEAAARNCELIVAPVTPGLAVRADRQLLHSAVSNLLQNAFKFTHAHGPVRLSATKAGGRVLIQVEDRCGGLPEGKVEAMFTPFAQYDDDRGGLGLGLSIARRAIEATGGKLTARDLPGLGCVFTVDLEQVA